jgi:D-aminopeptidase
MKKAVAHGVASPVVLLVGDALASDRHRRLMPSVNERQWQSKMSASAHDFPKFAKSVAEGMIRTSQKGALDGTG